MKVTAFNGSSRKNGNTATLVQTALGELENEGFETEFIQLAGTSIEGCRACYKCTKNKDKKCAVDSDALNEYFSKMVESDGIILASPVYFADVSAKMKALMERAGFVARANDDLLKRKAGAAVVAVRRAGSIHTFDSLNHFFLISQMIIPGSSYWNMGIGWQKGDMEKDEEGLATMKTLGQNMAWLIKKIKE
jgi:multimeric flavodoxin WrbA